MHCVFIVPVQLSENVKLLLASLTGFVAVPAACQVAQFGQVDGASFLQVALILKRALRKRMLQGSRGKGKSCFISNENININMNININI